MSACHEEQAARSTVTHHTMLGHFHWEGLELSLKTIVMHIGITTMLNLNMTNSRHNKVSVDIMYVRRLQLLSNHFDIN